MTRAISLAWKEWHEARAYLWIAMGIFVGLPIIGGLEGLLQYSHHFEVLASPWVTIFGGVLAVFMAVGATCRDFNNHLEDFWRSRPVSSTRWMLTKYFVGLAIVLFACELPLIIDLFSRSDGETLFVAIKEICRVEDVACRIGGEEFSILAPRTPADRAAMLAERMRASISKIQFESQSDKISVTCSFGVAEGGDKYDRSMLNRAEQALNEAKQSGRNRVIIAPPAAVAVAA